MKASKIFFFYNTKLDPAASAFISAYGITNPSQKAAINNLVLDLKSPTYGTLWTNVFTGMPIHPFVGGTASAHAGNLRNPGVNDISFSGGWTHSSTGALPNGTTGFASDSFVPSVGQVLNNNGFSIYLGTNNTTAGYDIGVSDGVGYSRLAGYFGGIIPKADINGVTVQTGATRSDGFFSVVNVTSVLDILYWNGAEIKRTSGSGPTGLPTIAMYYGALNTTGTAGYFSNRQIRFGCKHTSLTAQQSSDLYTIIQKFQTALGRNV